ncbi:hypothetical protein AADZ90_017980 [Aestuariibius sp. 2305UL40-4]|uniref:hypothetical protein n=1 Tax=Aestuariibius violaceus TaxID=3234132 RepID=UPI00345E1E72
MTVNFALSLSPEGIQLLHRVSDGWHLVGDTSLENPKLKSALEDLRRKGAALAAPDPLRCKLLLPNDQIKYITINRRDIDEDDVRHALAGTTPYTVDDLAYDWQTAGSYTFIAAVARETLNEAKDFAAQHGFGPVAFAAVPRPFTYDGEAFFGACDDSLNIARDDMPVQVTGIVEDTEAPVEDDPADALDLAEIAASLDEADEAPAVEDTPETPVEEVLSEEPEPQLEELDLTAAGEELELVPEQEAVVDAPEEEPQDQAETAEEIPSDAATLTADADEADTGAPDATEDAPPEAVTDEAETPLSESDGDTEAPSAEPQGEDTKAEEAETSEADLPDTEETATKDGPSEEGTPPSPADDQEEAAEEACDAITLPTVDEAERSAKASEAPVLTSELKPRITLAPLPDEAAPETPKLPAAPAAKSTASPAPTPLGAATSAPAAKTIPTPKAPVIRKNANEAERMTVFGARSAEASGRGPLKLAAAIALLAGLAGAGIWALAPKPDETTVTASAPAPEIAAPAQPAPQPAALSDTAPTALAALDSSDFVSPVIEAALTDRFQTGDIEAEPERQIAVVPELPRTDRAPSAERRVLSTDESRRIYAATGVWQKAPRRPDAPGQTLPGTLPTLPDDPGLAAVVPAAFATTPAVINDVPMAAPANPPQPEEEFDLDDRGFVRATPEGTVTPEGVVVYAGRPDLVPPQRPDAPEPAPADEAIADAAPEADATAGAVSLALLSEARPRPRPDAETDAETTDEPETLAAFRPQTRPEDIPEAASAEPTTTTPGAVENALQAALAAPPPPVASSSPQAVAQSIRPSVRPAGFSRTVARAQQSPAAAAPIQPRVVQPPAPTVTTAARGATVENAINLRRVNLIGVYGRPDNRSALVRLTNGRYVKVQRGDTLDGGRVATISDDQLLYVKRGRTIVLDIPSG